MPQPIIELESSKLMDKYTGDRPTFHGSIGGTDFQAFCCENGLLFLEVDCKVNGKMTDAKFAIIGGLMGGMVGAAAGMMLDQKAHEKRAGIMQLCSLKSDDELFEMAKRRKKSFVVGYDEFKWAKLEAPSHRKARLDNKVPHGWFTFKAKVVGKKSMVVHDAAVMGVAVDALPSRIAECLTVSVRFDEKLFRYVAMK